MAGKAVVASLPVAGNEERGEKENKRKIEEGEERKEKEKKKRELGGRRRMGFEEERRKETVNERMKIKAIFFTNNGRVAEREKSAFY